MAEVGSARLTSLERVTTGVGSVSSWAKPNSLGRSLRLPLPDGAFSFCPKWLLTDNRKIPDNEIRCNVDRYQNYSGNDLRYNECCIYHNAMLKTSLPTSW